MSFLHHSYHDHTLKVSTKAHHFGRRANLCSLASSAVSRNSESSSSSVARVSGRERKSQRKAARNSPEVQLRQKFDRCSKTGDLDEALRLYDEARSNGIPLNQHVYNALLYLCSLDEVKSSDLGLKRGFEILQQMVNDKVDPNEATFTNATRIAAGLEDPDKAFELVKQMKTFNIPPKLRSYGPALFGYCSNKEMADRAYEVYLDMIGCKVVPEEPEVSAILKVSSDAGKADRVYEMLHLLRRTVRQVTECMMSVVEGWFESEAAGRSGEVKWDVKNVREGVVKGGGGWHGQGWLGTGKWNVVRTQLDEDGVCCSCKEKLVCIDIDPRETEHFASSLSYLACKKEVKSDFIRFQLNNVANKLREMNPSKRYPLIILHKSRIKGGSANPNNQRLLERRMNSGSLYTTPPVLVICCCEVQEFVGDDDEMRDHLFQLLGTSFFPRWKEKHQVRISVSNSGVKLHMPPPYSIVTQESETGSWHVPMKTDDDLETTRQWICATRQRA